MSSVTRSLAIAAILPFLAASSAASAAIPDITAAETQSGAVFDVSGPAVIASGIDLTAPGDPKPATWAMLILGIAHLGVGLRCRAAALRLAPAPRKGKSRR